MTPYLTKKGNKTVLMVNDKPFIMLAGEIHNSDYTSISYMEGIYETADNLGMNTLLVPMSWDIVEPTEGNYDFSLTKDLIMQARKHDFKLVFLWFGSFKNAEMMYAPSWVKKNLARFFRAQIVKGENKSLREISPSIPVKFPYTTLSTFCEEARNLDAKAFSKFMGFIKSIDEKENTVIAVQVENETGLLGNSRDRSDIADAAFNAEVPSNFVSYMKSHTETMVSDIKEAVLKGKEKGNWKEVFTDAADEIFSAYQYSKYVEYVANKGKEAYNLPMTVNCWLDKNGKPGTFPTGGPVSRYHEVWDFNAPSIDTYSPDIYVPNFMEICDEYVRRGRPLFIPESATHSYCEPRLVYCVGHYQAICYSPFGFDDIGKPFSATQGFLFGMDVTDPALKTPQDAEEYGLTSKYLKALMPLIGKKLGSSEMDALTGEKKDTGMMFFNDISVMGMFKNQMQPRSDGYLFALKDGDDLYLLGCRCMAALLSNDKEKPNLDLLLHQEMVLDEKGNLTNQRRFNGDESTRFSFDSPTLVKINYFLYK